jgi:AhpD family alkylhydroperoxidase
MRTIMTALVLAALAHANTQSVTAPASAPAASDPPVVAVATLLTQARARVLMPARVALEPEAAPAPALEANLRLNGTGTPNYVRALRQMPQAGRPLAELAYAVLYRGALPTDTKASMGLRIAQVSASPYVAAHMTRILRASSGRGAAPLAAFENGTLAGLAERDRLAVSYAEQLTRSIHGVAPDDFARTRAAFNDSEIVELTLAVAFFNCFTRYAEALRLPVEDWAVDGPAPPAANAGMHAGVPRVALISDEEMAATSAAAAAASDAAQQRGGLGLGMANSQRAMLRAPALSQPWRVFGAAVREKETVGRDIKLQVSFAVSVANECRYCTLHQVLGLRRLGVDPAKLLAMRKDDSVLTPREAVAVRFARALTARPGAITDADYDTLKKEFGDLGALEVLLQTCTFAFMNRFTDGLLLPSEDEAVRVYQEVYGKVEGTGSR